MGVAMGDKWDYKLRKMDIAWELANRVIPKSAPSTSGKWTADKFLASAQETLQEAIDVVDAIFQEDKSDK